jgi:methionyl-tRNA formyltransferase
VVEQLRGMMPETMVVVGYGQIIPQAIIDIPPQGIINVHASLLPKYRGAAPIQWAIARGEDRTGVTTMRINAGLDTGDMLLKWETAIGAEETALELGERLAIAGADLLVRTLADHPQGEVQNDALATYAPILKKEDGHIDWGLSPGEILNRVRGFVPWPGCYGFLHGQRFHIWKARAGEVDFPAGALRAVNRRLFAGSLELLEVQLEGKKRMAAEAFLNGFPLKGDETLS